MDNKGINNANYKHGMTNTKFYNTWKSMKRRCYCKTFMAYCNYGGRGIVICDRWLDFNNFKKDMYKSYLLHVDNFGENDTSIERIDVNGNYELDNCKWATKKEQNSNRRIQKNQKEFYALSPSGDLYLYNSQNKCAKIHNLNQGGIYNCLTGRQKTQKGWTFKYKGENNESN